MRHEGRDTILFLLYHWCPGQSLTLYLIRNLLNKEMKTWMNEWMKNSERDWSEYLPFGFPGPISTLLHPVLCHRRLTCMTPSKVLSGLDLATRTGAAEGARRVVWVVWSPLPPSWDGLCKIPFQTTYLLVGKDKYSLPHHIRGSDTSFYLSMSLSSVVLLYVLYLHLCK